jgi:hypothetical protein
MIAIAVPHTGLIAVSQGGMGTFYMRQDQYVLWKEKANALRRDLKPATVVGMAEVAVLVMLLAAEIMNDRVTA